MNRVSRVTRLSVATGVVVATILLLSACTNPLEGFVKSATKGGVDLAGTNVPASFPKSVPLYKGQVTSGIQMGQDNDNIWNVIMKVPGPAVMPTIKSQLLAAGFTTTVDTTIGKDGGSLIFDNAQYDVAVVLKHTATGYTVDYAVTNQTPGDYSTDG
jgi:hypothetical protein